MIHFTRVALANSVFCSYQNNIFLYCCYPPPNAFLLDISPFQSWAHKNKCHFLQGTSFRPTFLHIILILDRHDEPAVHLRQLPWAPCHVEDLFISFILKCLGRRLYAGRRVSDARIFFIAFLLHLEGKSRAELSVEVPRLISCSITNSCDKLPKCIFSCLDDCRCSAPLQYSSSSSSDRSTKWNWGCSELSQWMAANNWQQLCVRTSSKLPND